MTPGASGAIPTAADDPAGAIASQTTRGFTGHEQLDDVGLVHMNGRVYDPLLARFGTPDPTTESPFSTQGWNRYSYVGNSPLNFTDPSGYCFMGCFWKPIFKAVGNFLKQSWGSILQIAAAAICAPSGLSAVCAAAAATFVTGVTSGNLGLALKAGLIAGVTAWAFKGIGDLTGELGLDGVVNAKLGGHGPLDFMSEAHIFNIAGHALVGCGSTVASGGKCGPGALSGAAGSFAGPLLKDLNYEGKLVATTVVGGAASVAGGGKFANGAVTAAFGYLFNESGRAPNDRHTLGTLEAMQDALENGYEILSAGPTLATISGAPNRSYDFVMSDPGTGQVIGAEVKTSWWGIIRLDEQQVNFDAQVADGVPAYSPSLGRQITGVQYYTYCFMCGIPGAPRQSVTIGSAALWLRLQGAGVNSIPVR